MRPAVAELTDEWFDSLPGYLRDSDASSEWPLLRFLSLVGDQAGAVAVLTARADYVAPTDGGVPGDTSDLVDPATADAGWLAWLAQFVGLEIERAPASFAMPYGELAAAHPTYADLSSYAATYGELAELTTTAGGQDVSTAREAIASAVSRRTGSLNAIRAAIAPYVDPTTTVDGGYVADIQDGLLDGGTAAAAGPDVADGGYLGQGVDVEGHYGGDPWALLVTIYENDVDEPWRVQRLLAAPDLKPAGFSLTVVSIAGG